MGLSIPQMALMSRLLDEALPLDTAGRRVWLATLATQYPDLAQALREALLPQDAQAVRLEALATLPKSGSADEANAIAASGLQCGARVGPYELIRLLGVGGMAEVWLARRADGAFIREVALKLPMFTRLRRDLDQRFAQERDILARLEHPYIARFYDAGVDPSGLPYLSMEYVQGQPLTNWCDVHVLGISERLELFLQVVGAVQYAHEHQVVHRDLKPSNILVTDFGQVRLLDFGVAKLLEVGDTDPTQLTGVYGRALTPDYASPEVLRGDFVDPRSDTYSLGVLLYELLTGARPYRLKNRASIGIDAQAIVSIDVKKPSTQLEQPAAAARGTTQESLARQLRGDLDVIALKALAKEPAERYPSVATLADDLQRFLDGKPIHARPARFAYRLRKFVLRNRTVALVTATSVALVTLAVAALLVSGYALWRARSGAGVTSVHVPPPGSAVTFSPPLHSIAVLPLANESGEASQQYFSDGISEDLITALSQLQGLEVIGRSSAFQFRDSKEDSRSIGAKLGVAHLLGGSVRRSGEMVRVNAELIDTADGSTQWSERYDRPYKDLFALQDEITRAVAEALKARLLPGEHAVAQSERPPGGSLEAYNALLQGQFYFLRQTEADHRKAIEYYSQATQLDPRYALAWSWLSAAWALFGAEYLAHAPAQEAYAKAREAAERALALSPELAAAHIARGVLLVEADLDWRGAEAEFRRALVLAPNDGVAKFLLGRRLATYGELEPAIDLTQQALITDPLRASWYNWLAWYFVRLNRLDEAERAVSRAIELQPTAVGYHNTLTMIEIQRGHAQAALAAAQQEPPGHWHDIALALARQIGGDRSAADAALRTLIDKDENFASYQIAEVYALRNDPNATFEWLDRTWSNRDPRVGYLLPDPFILRYKDDPRFAAFCRKVGLPVPGEASARKSP